MVEFRDRESLKAWLNDRPLEFARLIAARAALRSVPLLAELAEKEDGRSTILLPCFRALSVASLVSTWPKLATNAAVAAATNAIASAVNATNATYTAAANAHNAASTRAFAGAAIDAAASAHAFYSNANAASSAAAEAAAAAAATTTHATSARAVAAVHATSISAAANAAAWRAVKSDANFLEVAKEQGNDIAQIAVSLSIEPLWPGEVPELYASRWSALSRILGKAELASDEGEGWRVWTQWYEARLSGAPSIPDLDRARALISDEDWKQGPAHVNAIIKRLIEEHEGETTLPMGQENAIPRLPNPLPSPSTYIAQNGTADLVEATTLPVPSNSAETAWKVLTETLSDLQHSCGHNAPMVTASLNRVARALGNSPQEVDVVRCGMAWLELKALAEVTDSNLMGETVAQVKSLAVQLGVFSAQFEDWQEFFAQLPDVASGQGSLNEAAKLVGEIHTNLVEGGNLTDPANEQLTEEHQAALPGSTEFDHAPVPALETKAGFVRSGLALIRAFAVDVLREGRKLAVKGIAGLTVGTIGGSATVLLAQSETILKLANTLPAEWSWAADLIMWLRALVGG